MKTFQEVRNLLSVIEPDEKMYAQITRDELPQLQILLKECEAWLSARAILALSRLKNEKAELLIKEATNDKRSEVRMAIAVALPRIHTPLAEEILDTLLKDDEFRVKKLAIYAVPEDPNEAIKKQLQILSLHDKHAYIKSISSEKLSTIQLMKPHRWTVKKWNLNTKAARLVHGFADAVLHYISGKEAGNLNTASKFI